MRKRLIGTAALLAFLVLVGTGVAQQSGGTAPAGKGGKPGSPTAGSAPGSPTAGSRPPSPGPQLPDSTLVVRGGTCTADSFTKGSGVKTDAQGKLSGVSVNAAANLTLDQLTKGVPHNQVGVTTVGAINQAGGQVVPDPTKGNPNHALVSGVSAAQLSQLFTQGLQKNPNAKAKPKGKDKAKPKPKPKPKPPAKSKAA
jgi:hypothetical protein